MFDSKSSHHPRYHFLPLLSIAPHNLFQPRDKMSKISKDTAQMRSGSLTGSERANNLVSLELADLESSRREDEQKASCCTTWEASLETLQEYFRIAKRHPHIWVFTLLSIVILCGISLPLIVYIANNQNEKEEALASDLAIETGRWFCTYNIPQSITSCTVTSDSHISTCLLAFSGST